MRSPFATICVTGEPPPKPHTATTALVCQILRGDRIARQILRCNIDSICACSLSLPRCTGVALPATSWLNNHSSHFTSLAVPVALSRHVDVIITKRQHGYDSLCSLAVSISAAQCRQMVTAAIKVSPRSQLKSCRSAVTPDLLSPITGKSCQ